MYLLFAFAISLQILLALAERSICTRFWIYCLIFPKESLPVMSIQWIAHALRYFYFLFLSFCRHSWRVRAAKIATVQYFLSWQVWHFSLSDNAMNSWMIMWFLLFKPFSHLSLFICRDFMFSFKLLEWERFQNSRRKTCPHPLYWRGTGQLKVAFTGIGQNPLQTGEKNHNIYMQSRAEIWPELI